jgi:hypothetical protein
LSASKAATFILYLGKYRSSASREAYKRFVEEWSRNGGELPARTNLVTVTEIVLAYTEFANLYYRKDGKPTDEVRMIKSAIKIARQLYGRTPAIEFGPLWLKAYRQQMMVKSRINCNTGIWR